MSQSLMLGKGATLARARAFSRPYIFVGAVDSSFRCIIVSHVLHGTQGKTSQVFVVEEALERQEREVVGCCSSS